VLLSGGDGFGDGWRRLDWCGVGNADLDDVVLVFTGQDRSDFGGVGDAVADGAAAER